MAKRRMSPDQFDLFEPPKPSAEQPPSPPDEEGPVPAAEEAPYEPTPEDEQARLEMEHGPGVTYRPPKTRQEREAEKRNIKCMMDDALGRMGEPGKQLLDPTESPFAQGGREEDERRKRKKGR